MSLRAVYILQNVSKNKPKCLFVKFFPTVEKRAAHVEGDSYVPVPPLSELMSSVAQELEVISNTETDTPTCSHRNDGPVHTLSTSGGQLWPFLIIQQSSLLYCCLCAVDGGSHKRPDTVQVPAISAGFTLLMGMAAFLGPVPKNIDESWSKLSELHLYVGASAPFGRPVDVDPTVVRAHLTTKGTSAPVPKEKQPAWKPLQYKGKAQILVTIKETIRCCQYDSLDKPDAVDVNGTITCRADLEGTAPDVTLTLCHADDTPSCPLTYATYHPFVQSVETQGQFMMRDEGYGPGSCRLRFMPPLDTFPLCLYKASLPLPPIQGFYQIKGEKSVELLLQLKLNPGVRNQMDFCEVQLPFHHRGIIKTFDASPNHGNVILSPDKTTLVWNMGKSFPSKTLEVLLKATAQFSTYNVKNCKTTEQHICVGNNAFAQIFFKISDFTQTGLMLDQKSLQLSPGNKFKLTYVREYVAGDYKIWNSHGDSPSGFVPDIDTLQQIHSA